MAVTRDLSSGHFFPATNGEWGEHVAGTTVPVPNWAFWGFQEAAGNVADLSGNGRTFVAAGAGISYQQAMTNVSRKAIKLADSGGAFSITGPDPATTSFLMIVAVAVTATPAATRTLFEHPALWTELTATPRFQANGGNVTTGAVVPGTSVRWLVFKYDRGAGASPVYVDNAEKITPVYFGGAAVGPISIGKTSASAAPTAPMAVLYAAAWSGAAAQFSDAQIATLIYRMKNGPARTIIAPGVTRDLTARKLWPADLVEWNRMIASSGIGSPMANWNFQETAGPVIDTIGTGALSVSGSQYGLVIPGLARKGCGHTVDGAADSTINGAIGDTQTASHLLLAWVHTPIITGAAGRDMMGIGLGAGYRYMGMTVTGKPYIAGLGGQATANGTRSMKSTTARLYALRVNRTAGTFSLITEDEVINAPYTAPAGTAGVVFGSALSGACVRYFAGAALWRGAAAEMTDDQVRTLFALLRGDVRGPAIADTIAMDAEDGSSMAYAWATNIIPSLSGKESRIALLGAPRESYRFNAALTDAQLAKLRTSLVVDAAAAKAYAIGISPESIQIASQAMVRSWSADPSVEVKTTAFADWTYPGARAVVVSPDGSRQWNCVVRGGLTEATYPWTIQKNGGVDGVRDAGLSSAYKFYGDCAVEVTMGALSRIAFGLAPPNTTTTRDSGYFWEPTEPAANQAWVREFGVDKGSMAIWAVGDVLRVERVGPTVRYYQNGTLRYTSLTASSGPLVVDFCFMYASSQYTNIRAWDRGVPVGFAWENQVNVVVTSTGQVQTGRYPSSAADMAAATRWGVWDAAYAFDETTGNATALWGAPATLTKTVGSGEIIQGLPGPLGDADKATRQIAPVGAGNNYFDGGNNFDVDATKDLNFVLVTKLNGHTDTFCTLLSKVNGAWAQGWALGNFTLTNLFFNQGAAGSLGSNVEVAQFFGDWVAIMGVIARDRSVSALAVQSLTTGVVVSSEGGISATSFSNAATLRVGASAWVSKATPATHSFLAIGSSVGSAKGMSENIRAALGNFVDTIVPRRIWVDTLGDGMPKSTTALRAAWGTGQWSSLYLCNETSGNLRDACGAGSQLVPASSPAYGAPGALGDSAVVLDSDNDGFTAATFDAGATTDILFGALIKHDALPNGVAMNKYDGTPGTGYLVQYDTLGNLYWRIQIAFAAFDSIVKAPIGEWYLALFILERAIGKAMVAILNLATDEVTLGAQVAVPASSLSNGSQFSLGASAWLAPAVRGSFSAFMAGVAVGAATGTIAKAEQMLRSFRNYILPSFGSRIMPAVPSYLGDGNGVQVYPANAGKYQLDARAIVWGNRSGSWTPRPAPHIVDYKPFLESSYIPVWDRRIVVDGSSPQTLEHKSQMIDRGGAIQLVGYANVSDFKRELALNVKDDADRQYLKAFMGRCTGMQKAFFLPTWKPDLLPTTGDASGGTLKIKSQDDGGVNYAAKWLQSPAHKTLQFVCADGSIVYRTVTDAVDNLDGTQTLQLDLAVTGTTVVTVSFLERCRFDSDSFEVAYASALGSSKIPVLVVQR